MTTATLTRATAPSLLLVLALALALVLVPGAAAAAEADNGRARRPATRGGRTHDRREIEGDGPDGDGRRRDAWGGRGADRRPGKGSEGRGLRMRNLKNLFAARTTGADEAAAMMPPPPPLPVAPTPPGFGEWWDPAASSTTTTSTTTTTTTKAAIWVPPNIVDPSLLLPPTTTTTTATTSSTLPLWLLTQDMPSKSPTAAPSATSTTSPARDTPRPTPRPSTSRPTRPETPSPARGPTSPPTRPAPESGSPARRPTNTPTSSSSPTTYAHALPDRSPTPPPTRVPSADPSDAPSERPTAPPSTTETTSVARNCTQTLWIRTREEFDRTEVDIYQSVMEGYTEEFGHGVGEPRIATTCDVTGQEASRGDLAILFTIRYESRYGYDVDCYPRLFQDYINSNLQRVTDDMMLLPVIDAQNVSVLATAEPMSETAHHIGKDCTIGPPLASVIPSNVVTDVNQPTTSPAEDNRVVMGLVFGLLGVVMVLWLIRYARRRTNLRNATQEEDGELPGWSAAVEFDFVFSNKTESDALCLEVSNKLVSRGVTVWQQRTNIPKDTDNWFNEWFPSAVRARKIVCFLTMEYLKSPYCMREFGIALNSNRLLVVACEPLAKINELDPSDYPYASNALAYLINGGQVIFHDSEDVIAEILKFAGGSNDEDAGACTELRPVDKAHLMNGGQVIFHVSKDMVAKNLGGSNVTEVFDFVFSNKTQSDALCLEVRDKLISHGVKVWQQRTNIPKDSDNWFDEWFQSARKARKIVCFLTADYIKSPFCMKEFGIALNTNKLLAVAIDPLAKINEVDPSAYPKASNALAYLINGGEVIIHDSDDVVAEILKFATSPGEANPNDAEAETQAEPCPVRT